MDDESCSSAADVIRRARRQGIVLFVDGSDLVCDDYRGTLTDELRDQLRAHKPKILELLRAARTYTCSSCGRFRFDLPTLCYWCRRRSNGLADCGITRLRTPHR